MCGNGGGREQVFPSSSAAVGFNLALVQACTLVERLTAVVLVASVYSGVIFLGPFWPACSLVWNQRASVSGAARLLLQAKLIYMFVLEFFLGVCTNVFADGKPELEKWNHLGCNYPVSGWSSACRPHCLQNLCLKTSLNGNKGQKSRQLLHL